MFIRCYWAVPEWARGERVRRVFRMGNHTLEVEFARRSMVGQHVIPDWWMDNLMATQPER